MRSGLAKIKRSMCGGRKPERTQKGFYVKGEAQGRAETAQGGRLLPVKVFQQRLFPAKTAFLWNFQAVF